MASAKRSYKAQYHGKEKEEGKRKDGKTTSESGPVPTSTAVKRAAEGRQRWQKIVADVSSGAPTTLMVPGRNFFIPSMIAGTLAVIGCDSLLFYARISLDKDLSC